VLSLVKDLLWPWTSHRWYLTNNIYHGEDLSWETTLAFSNKKTAGIGITFQFFNNFPSNHQYPQLQWYVFKSKRQLYFASFLGQLHIVLFNPLADCLIQTQ
jgi:hypothetical protein